jgi:hypothetical protein
MSSITGVKMVFKNSRGLFKDFSLRETVRDSPLPWLTIYLIVGEHYFPNAIE